jgi:hypothetical protein
MRTVLLTLIALSLALSSGCTQTVKVSMSSAVLRLDGVVKSPNGEERFLLTFSNGLPRSVRFYEISPDRLACAIQMEEAGRWTNVNAVSYCATGWDTILVKPGESHQMTIPAYPFRKPWRVGIQYWEVEPDGSIQHESPREVWTDTLPPPRR